jgi:hypothetical protein
VIILYQINDIEQPLLFDSLSGARRLPRIGLSETSVPRVDQETTSFPAPRRHFADGSARRWNRIALLVVPLPVQPPLGLSTRPSLHFVYCPVGYGTRSTQDEAAGRRGENSDGGKPGR